MLQFFKKSDKGGKGFTLIELLVVIAIIGILASIVLASLNTARERSRDARRIADISQIRLALELYFDANSSYPADTADLVTPIAYIPAVPSDPLVSFGAYPYSGDPATCTTGANDCLSYHLGALLEGDNQALDSDADGTVGFPGVSDDCVNVTVDDFCYDIIP